MKTHITTKPHSPRPAGIRFGLRPTVVSLLAAAWCWLLPLCPAQAAPEAFQEYEVKAVFLLNFAQFIEWPQGAFQDAETPLTIGVLGNDAFAGMLEQAVKGEKVKGRSLVIKRFLSMDEVTTCHVLFVSRSWEARLKELSGLLEREGVLTVGESSRFTGQGGVINFFLQGNKIRFEINPGLARTKGLKISAQLLSLGKIVESVSSKERH